MVHLKTLVGCVLLLSASPVVAGVVELPREPALSPDGALISFTWAGDIWAVSRDGGVATRVTSHPADERRSAFSPDGSVLAFESDRDGARNLYTVNLQGNPPALFASTPTRVTEWDQSQSLSAFSLDGKHLYFSGRVEPSIYRHARMYKAPLDGGPIERLTEAFGIHPMPSDDGAVIFSRGYEIANRPAYRGPGAKDLWRMAADGNFTQLTFDPSNDMAGHELPDGSIVFVSSRDGQNNVYRLDAGATDQDEGALRQLTQYSTGREVTIGHGVHSLTVSADGSTAAFVVWDTLYTLDLTRRNSRPVEVRMTASGDDATPDRNVINVSTQAREIAWHPSGKAVALAARGEIWLRSTDEDQPTRRITNTPWRERNLAWSADGSTLYFVADDESSLGSILAATVDLSREDLAGAPVDEEEDDALDEDDDAAADSEGNDAASDEDADEGNDDGDDSDADDADSDGKDKASRTNPHGDRWASSITFTIEPVVNEATWDRMPMPAPDGRSMLFVRGLGDLIHLNLGTGEQRVVFTGWEEPEVQWMPDARHIVFARSDLDFNSDIWLLDLDADSVDDAVNLTRHPDIDTSPRLSADGKVLVFLSDRAGENWSYDVHRVYLDAALDQMTNYERAEYFEDAAKAAKKRKPLMPVADEDSNEAAEEDADVMEFDADDAWLRIRRVTSHPGSEGSLAITPGGERIVYSATIDGTTALRSVAFDGSEQKTVMPGSVSGVAVSLTGGAVAALRNGRAQSGSPTGGEVTTYPIDAEVRITNRIEQRQKFLEGARTFGYTFYNIKGLDWPALIDRYLPLAERARTSAEFNAIFSMLLGEVNGSHTGIRGGSRFNTSGASTGYLCVDLAQESAGYRVTRVLPDGPGDNGDAGLQPDDVIIAINSESLSRGGQLRDFNAAMTGTAGTETLLKILRNGEDAHLLVTPRGYGFENNLRYRDEVAQRRDEVERLSEGRLGYLHIRGMSMPSVRDFERDLYAAAHGRDGLVIDVRDNGGGFTTDILLASLTAPRHAYTIPRGADPADVEPDHYPRDRRLIYGWTRPINVLINQHSFSNAEIFAHSIKTAGRGRLIGTTTFGGVISTGGFSLIDGTFIRQPFRGWYLPDGRDMDVYGAEPDVPVAQSPGEEVAGRDAQLEAAVVDLLDQIDNRKDPRAIH
ncbi:MAG: S41 family peptidase [Planctomycetota bacterium]